MPIVLENLDRLPRDIHLKVESWIIKLISLHESQLHSVYLYGSATGIDYVAQRSDVNLLVVFKELRFDSLRKTLPLIKEGAGLKISAPLFLTFQQIEESLDVFAVEFLELKENHLLLYGKDILSKLQIPQEHIRLYCEQQLKGKFIRLRQVYLEQGSNAKQIPLILRESLNSFIPVFRNLLRLKQQEPPLNKIPLIEKLALTFHMDPRYLLAVYHYVFSPEVKIPYNLDQIMSGYLKDIEDLAHQLNDL